MTYKVMRAYTSLYRPIEKHINVSQCIFYSYSMGNWYIHLFSKPYDVSQIQNYNKPNLNAKTVHYEKIQFK